jgi:predicted GIY-YIG superfamily endonuclease
VRLLGEPALVPRLAPLIQQEISIRLLAGPHGPQLRHLVTVGSPSQQIGRAVAWLKHNFVQALPWDDLADRAHMTRAKSDRRPFSVCTQSDPRVERMCVPLCSEMNSPQKSFEFLRGAECHAFSSMRCIGRRFVYVLRSERDPARHYVGITSDVDERLAWHNSELAGHTRGQQPWRPIVVIESLEERTAAATFQR